MFMEKNNRAKKSVVWLIQFTFMFPQRSFKNTHYICPLCALCWPITIKGIIVRTYNTSHFLAFWGKPAYQVSRVLTVEDIWPLVLVEFSLGEHTILLCSNLHSLRDHFCASVEPEVEDASLLKSVCSLCRVRKYSVKVWTFSWNDCQTKLRHIVAPDSFLLQMRSVRSKTIWHQLLHLWWEWRSCRILWRTQL